MAEERQLVGGPQDGGLVRKSGDTCLLPDTIYIGPKPLGDGYVAWSDELCKRFPVEHQRSGEVFVFRRYVHPVETKP